MLQRMIVLGWIGCFFWYVPVQSIDAQTTLATLTPVPIQEGVAELAPANTMIQFIGAHAGAEPNPRVGHFQDFAGQARLNSSASAVESITVEIRTESLTTPIPNLTNHLKSPDFLDVREYPTAKFQTIQISPGGDPGQFQISGELTLHGTTVPLAFPATIEVGDGGITLQAELTIDRTDFGMNLLTDRVVNEVELNLAIGKTAQAEGQANTNPGRRFDPGAFFRERDTNGDGKLSGDELTDRLRDSISDFDTDNDGAISLAEFEARVRAIGGRVGGGRRGGSDRRSDRE